MNEHERVKLVRKELNMTLEAFGNKLGVTKTAISNIERGERNLTEQMLKAICREFKVDYFWLRDGVGDMFIDLPDDTIDELALEYDMSDMEKKIVKNYFSMDTATRETFINALHKLFD